MADEKKSGIFAESIKTCGDTLYDKIFRPVVQKAVYDILTSTTSALTTAVNQAIDCMIFGKDNMGQHNTIAANSINFSAISTQKAKQNAVGNAALTGEPIHKTAVTFDDIPFATQEAATNILSCLRDMNEKYGVVRITDYYDISQVSCPNLGYKNYGWYNLKNAVVKQVPLGWSIAFPPAVYLS